MTARGPAIDRRGLARTARQVLSVTAFAVIPAIALLTMLATGLSDDSLSADFHHEIYPQARQMLDGDNPYPAPNFDPTAAPNFIWPPSVAVVVSPLLLLPLAAADIVMVAVGLTCIAASLWLVGLRDWRVYGLVALWPQVTGEMRVSHLTAPLCLLLALAWRSRDRRLEAGLAIGVATSLKFFVWPLAVWLAATRRYAAAALAGGLAILSLALLVPFVPVDHYFRSLLTLGRAFDQDSYTVFGLLVQSGASETVARIATWATAAVLLVATWRRRSFALAIATALVASPIVWLDYFALAAIPLAIARPKLSWVWFLPLATWGLPGAGLGIGDPAGMARLLLVFTVVLAVAERGEPDSCEARAPMDGRTIAATR